MMEEVVLSGADEPPPKEGAQPPGGEAVVAEVHNSAGVASDDFDDEEDGRPLERWAPLGAAAPSPTPTSATESKMPMTEDRMKALEEEQEQLNTALLELTTHFAQVQFRLDQVNKSDPAEKEKLLAELTEFASRGCPDIMQVKKSRSTQRERTSSGSGSVTSAEHEAILERQRQQQLQLISQLKEQLEDLERFAYETGEGGIPSSELMQKQRVIIDSLTNKIDLPVDQLEKLSPEDLQLHVDQAVKKLINPMKLKDHLVDQLKTQIDDLHRFIEFLQGPEGQIECTCLREGDDPEVRHFCLLHHPERAKIRPGKKGFGSVYSRETEAASESSSSFSHTVYLLQLYLLQQMGCKSRNFRKNELKKTSKGNHWGDLRAALELSVDKVADIAAREQPREHSKHVGRRTSSDDDEDDFEDVFAGSSERLIAAVRKDLCPALRDLFQHGLLQPGYTANAVVPLGCLPARTKLPEQVLHAWDIILKYFEMKHGREFNEMPMRKLSQSFNLDSIGGKAITSKQLLLGTVDGILSSHSKLKRSPDAHWKAFVCAALNHKKLVAWLRMILRTREITEENYCSWSYVNRTGFEDSFKSLEKLSHYTFQLPVDLAVRPFQNIKDAF